VVFSAPYGENAGSFPGANNAGWMKRRLFDVLSGSPTISSQVSEVLWLKKKRKLP
jgi:hypothetical protein